MTTQPHGRQPEPEQEQESERELGGTVQGALLETDRLLLRPVTAADAPSVQRLAGHPDIARTTLNIPHPYPDGAAEAWIQAANEAERAGTQYVRVMVRKDSGALVGCVALGVAQRHHRAELAYWVGRPWWNLGYASEAARRMVQFAFTDLGLHRVWAAAMPHNPASMRVMEKIGMQREGLLRQHAFKDGHFIDLVYYGIVKGDPLP
ncbi:GNAT family N-acetyltransferase [Alicyclobacillus macrosporangiidus]|uniref:GNAT family N-acetyltransferase n=1 Tax=Alicyclobacillus macrosporangiidus TaxID=392015 RepID=UPI0026E9FBC3|nr:GNAT family N-acetyltransferase [Alicyclobacillus macrosporangiidus]